MVECLDHLAGLSRLPRIATLVMFMEKTEKVKSCIKSIKVSDHYKTFFFIGLPRHGFDLGSRSRTLAPLINFALPRNQERPL